MRMRNTLATLCAMVLGPVLALNGNITGAPISAANGGTWMVAQQQRQDTAKAKDTMRQKNQQQKQQSQNGQQRQNGQQSAGQIEAKPVLTTSIQDKEPQDTLQSNAQVQADSVIMWTQITGVQQGDSVMVKHVWRHNGEEAFTVELPVKGPTWRTWSYNTIEPNEAGEWEVAVMGPNNEELATMQFTAAPPGGSSPQARADGQSQMNGQSTRQPNGQSGQMDRDTSRQQNGMNGQSGQMGRDTSRQSPMGQQNGQSGQMGQAMQRWSNFAEQCLGQDLSNADSTISGTILSMTPSQGQNGSQPPNGQREQNGQSQQPGQMGRMGQSSQSSAMASDLRFTLSTDNNQQVTVYAGPKSQAAQDLKLSAGDEVTLMGMSCQQDGQQVFVPASIEHNGQTYELSQKNGAPKWEAKNGMNGKNGHQRKPDTLRQQPDTGRTGSPDSPSGR